MMFSRTTSIYIAISAIILCGFYWSLYGPTSTPKLDPNKYWGPSSRKNKTDSKSIKSFKVDYPPEVIDDLRKRLTESSKVKLVAPLEGVGFRYGFHKSKVADLIKYWNDDYLPRWTERQTYLNKFPQFQTEIQGLKIHFIHVKGQDSKAKRTIPLLLLHGWPGSVREFYELIPKLTSANNKIGVQFTVVVPSLPGYGWSDAASIPGLNPTEISVIMQNLMLKLGYNEFMVQGGDWGSVIGSGIASLYPKSVIAYHSNLCTTLTPGSLLKGYIAGIIPQLFIPEVFQSFVFPIGEKLRFLVEESGYFHLQATKPDTIGTVLSHSPASLAIYILEKFSTWTNPNYRSRDDGGLDRDFSKDALFDNIMIYYLTNSITTSMRIYSESYAKNYMAMKMEHVSTKVPTGCARFKHDIFHEIDWQLSNKFTNLIHSTYHKDGGHFIAMQIPKLLHEDLVNFVHRLESYRYIV